MYATLQHLIDRYGEDALIVASDVTGAGVVDGAAVDQALQDASEEIDAYVAARYPLPLETVPGVLTRLCCDVALYRLSDDAGTLTEEKRKRYDDAVGLLKSIAKGTASLGIPDPPAAVDGSAQGTKTAADRVFTRDTMRNF